LDEETTGVAGELLKKTLVVGGGDVGAVCATGEFGDADKRVALGDGAGDPGAVGGEEVAEGDVVAEAEAESGVGHDEVEVAKGGRLAEGGAAGGETIEAG